MEQEKPCVAHMCVFGSIVNAMVPSNKKGKLDAKGINFEFLGYCEGMKAYRVMFLETKILICKDVVFMKDSGSIINDLEMRSNGRNEGLMGVVVVDEFSKSPLFDGGG